MAGPVPKRSSQRRRVNKPAVPITKGVTDGAVRGPDLEGEHSDLGRRFWESLRRSGQSQWYQQSDWLAAEILVTAIDSFARKPTAFMLGQINSSMTPLLVTEGDRRRLHVELEPAEDPGSERDAAIARLDDFRQSVTS